MHEWGLSHRLLKLIEEEAQTRQLRRVSRVRLETGALSAAEREALRFNFQIASQGTVAQGAELDIDECPTQAFCPGCLSNVMITFSDQACPRCQMQALTPLGGEVLRITELVAS